MVESEQKHDEVEQKLKATPKNLELVKQVVFKVTQSTYKKPKK